MRIHVALRPSSADPGRNFQLSEPVTCGVPLPRGTVASQSWRAVTARGWHAVQARALDQWSDGSPRWLLVDTVLPSGQDRLSELWLEPSDVPIAIVPPSTVSTDGRRVHFTVGSTAVDVTPGGAFPFTLRGRQGSALVVTDGHGRAHHTVVDDVVIEEQGPLRAVVRVTSDIEGLGDVPLRITARLHVWSGLPCLRVAITVTNPNRAHHRGGFWDLGDPGSILLEDVSLRVPVTPGAESRIRVSAERTLGWADAESMVEVYQDSSGGEQWESPNHLNRERRVPLSFRGYRLRTGSANVGGLRATPAVVAGTDAEAVGIAVPYFWQNFPQAVEASARFVTWSLFPGQHGDVHELQGGEQKTHECWLAFGGADEVQEWMEWARAPRVAVVEPTWTLESGAVPFLQPLTGDHAALANQAIEGPDRFEVKRERIDEFGWRHFGEIYGDHEGVRKTEGWPLISHYNNQYDPIAGFACQFLRTGDPRWWHLMGELASHVVDIDVYHTSRDKAAYNHGLFWHTYHYGEADTATHRTYPRSALGRTHGGGPSADHNYTTGLMLHYFMTGDPRSRDTVIDLADFVIAIDDGRRTVFRWLDRGDTGRAMASAPGYFGPGRGPANSLNALVDGYRLTGFERFRQKIDQLVGRVIHPEDDIAARRLDVPEQRWFYTMFLQSLGKYLHDKAERGELDARYAYGRAALEHYVRWMADHEHPYLEKPEKLEFPTETWPAQDIRKSDVFAFAALHARDAAWRDRCLERARFFHDYATRTLKERPTRALARPVVVVLTSGFLTPWLLAHPTAAEPAPAVDRTEFSPVQAFVPQRTRAVRRAKIIAMAAAAMAAGLAAGAVWYLTVCCG